MKPYYADEHVTLYHGDCLDVLAALPDASVDAVVTDPPYGLRFMGRAWDGADIEAATALRRRQAAMPEDGRSGANGGYRSPSAEAGRYDLTANAAFGQWCESWARECLRVLKPGGHLLAFGGSRTWHRLATAVEDAGFEIRDSIAWLYGSGMPKAWNLSTQYTGEWCSCAGENALPYNHAGNAEVRSLRDDVHPSPIPRGEGQDPDVLAPVQREVARGGVGDSRPQGARGVVRGVGGVVPGEDERRAEPGVEGRELHRAGQGLPDDSQAGAPASASEWLRGGTPAGDGGDDRATGNAAGGGASHQRRSGGQPPREPEAVRGPHGALDDRALRYGPKCARCGGLSPAFRGFSSALKPAFEPVVVARKPLEGTVAANVLAHGTGALNVDGCRVGAGLFVPGGGGNLPSGGIMNSGKPSTAGHTSGRWPANVVLGHTPDCDVIYEGRGEIRLEGPCAPGCPVAELDRQSGESSSRVGKPRGAAHGDTGGASRFFYVAKAPTSERPRYTKPARLRLRDDLTPEQVGHVRARLAEVGVQVD